MDFFLTHSDFPNKVSQSCGAQMPHNMHRARMQHQGACGWAQVSTRQTRAQFIQVHDKVFMSGGDLARNDASQSLQIPSYSAANEMMHLPPQHYITHTEAKCSARTKPQTHASSRVLFTTHHYLFLVSKSEKWFCSCLAAIIWAGCWNKYIGWCVAAERSRKGFLCQMSHTLGEGRKTTFRFKGATNFAGYRIPLPGMREKTFKFKTCRKKLWNVDCFDLAF
jgi:hypothetical protein